MTSRIRSWNKGDGDHILNEGGNLPVMTSKILL